MRMRSLLQRPPWCAQADEALKVCRFASYPQTRQCFRLTRSTRRQSRLSGLHTCSSGEKPMERLLENASRPQKLIKQFSVHHKHEQQSLNFALYTAKNNSTEPNTAAAVNLQPTPQFFIKLTAASLAGKPSQCYKQATHDSHVELKCRGKIEKENVSGMCIE